MQKYLGDVPGVIYCVSQKEVIKILMLYCSRSKKNLTIPVHWTKCSSLLDLCSKYQQNSLIITQNTSNYSATCMEPLFPLSQNVAVLLHVGVQSYSKICRHCLIHFSLKVIVIVSWDKNQTSTSKHRNIIVITTTELYFLPLPEKYHYPSISLLRK